MKKLGRNDKGQFVIEAVLLMIVTIGLFIWGTNQLREGKYLAKLIEGPWQQVAGMIESGVWSSPEKSRQKHPNQISRSITVDPNK